MKRSLSSRLAILALFAVPLTAGCGDSSQPETVAQGDEIEQFLAENPEMAVDMEEEAGLMEGDQAVEGE